MGGLASCGWVDGWGGQWMGEWKENNRNFLCYFDLLQEIQFIIYK